MKSLLYTAAALVVSASGEGVAQNQNARPRIDVEHYRIDAEVNPRTQTLNATVQVRFIPTAELTTATFELNNALNLSRVVDEAGHQIPASRSQQDFSIRLNFPTALPAGKPSSVTFTYDGRLAGNEESPVYGIKFAAIKPEGAYLMYPARWFPVNEYTVDRFTADMNITAPSSFRVIASGNSSAPDVAGDRSTYKYHFTQPSFPGSIALVTGEPKRVTSEGITSAIYFTTQKDMAAPYGTEIGKIMTWFTGVYGLPPSAALTVVETENGTPNGYAAPGILFLSPRSIGKTVNVRVLANQISRQWWGGLVSPTSRNHVWLTNGNARYAELLYLEHSAGQGAFETELRDSFIEALTLDNIPVIQSGRLEDYSPEFWAATAAKGSAVLQMLRNIVGDQKMTQILKTANERYAWKQMSTDDFRKISEEIGGQNLQGFFLQWIESTGAPEFKLEYTTYRTTKGFRVMGKISQDLDTFRMPVDLKIETEGNPETKRVEVVGTSSEFVLDTFGKPRKVIIDPDNHVLRFSNPIRVAVAIRKGEQFAEIGEFTDALKEYQKALDVSRNSSLAHYRVAEIFMLQNNYQSAANEFREVFNGDLDPKWTEVWAHINLGKIFDITGQRDRAVNEYQLAQRTKDNSQGAQEEIAKYLKTPYERPRSNN
ncbi:MAG TPA: M1 family aminopeptidase [Bryobacteraceae bacterium]|nr:M1 family aminopeptidase [Bryobacteraceae bacterium]